MPYCHRARVTRALPRVVAVLTAFVAAATLGAATATANPTPTNPPKVDVKRLDPKLSNRISAVNAQLARLSRENDQLDEQYNVAAAAVTTAEQSAQQAQQAADRAEARYEAAHRQFLQAVTQQYESGPSSSVANLLTSSAPQRYLDGLALADYLSGDFASAVHAEQAARADAAQAKQRAVAAAGTTSAGTRRS